MVCERASVGVLDPAEGSAEGEQGVVLEKGVVVECGAVVEARVIGEGSVVEVGARVGRGAVVGKVSFGEITSPPPKKTEMVLVFGTRLGGVEIFFFLSILSSSPFFIFSILFEFLSIS